jgi:hypothetical protein
MGQSSGVNWNRLVFAVAGISCLVISAFVPPAAGWLVPTGLALAGVAVPSELAAPVVNAVAGKKKGNEDGVQE